MPTSVEEKASDARLVGLLAFHRQRKQSSHDRLLAAAVELFSERGYAGVGIEEISAAAGVSRATFYRHFSGKSDLAAALFREATAEGRPLVLAIAERDYRDRSIVIDWLTHLFAGDREKRGIIRVFIQANAEEADFTRQAQPFVDDLVASLGKTIPAFAADPRKPAERRQWLKARLLIYTILDQSNHAARDVGVSTDPLMIEVLADEFLEFVEACPDKATYSRIIA